MVPRQQAGHMIAIDTPVRILVLALEPKGPSTHDRGIENETFNVLKTKGYNLEHNFGHGKQHLATVLAILNLLAFACHTVCELGDRAWRAARRELVTRQGFFQNLRTITTYLVFQSWDELLGTMAFTRPPPLGP
jgi:hypothetical protein